MHQNFFPSGGHDALLMAKSQLCQLVTTVKTFIVIGGDCWCKNAVTNLWDYVQAYRNEKFQWRYINLTAFSLTLSTPVPSPPSSCPCPPCFQQILQGSDFLWQTWPPCPGRSPSLLPNYAGLRPRCSWSVLGNIPAVPPYPASPGSVWVFTHSPSPPPAPVSSAYHSWVTRGYLPPISRMRGRTPMMYTIIAIESTLGHALFAMQEVAWTVLQVAHRQSAPVTVSVKRKLHAIGPLIPDGQIYWIYLKSRCMLAWLLENDS